MKRYVGNVIDAMLAVIPVEEIEFRAALHRAKPFLELPEDGSLHWSRAAEVLERHLPAHASDNNAWQRQVVALWRGDPVPAPSRKPPTKDAHALFGLQVVNRLTKVLVEAALDGQEVEFEEDGDFVQGRDTGGRTFRVRIHPRNPR